MLSYESVPEMRNRVRVAALAADSLDVLCDHRHALYTEILGVDCDERFPGRRSRYIRYYARLMSRQKGVAIAASVGDEIVGSATAKILDDYRGAVFKQQSGQINGMLVIKSWRRQRVGSALLDALFAWLLSRGCSSVHLTPTENARSFYESAGFRNIARNVRLWNGSARRCNVVPGRTLT
jgi:GNAT superfamily N-acetyltransferase